MRVIPLSLFILLVALPVRAQPGPCTEAAVKAGHLRPADDAFTFMPAFGRPTVGTPARRAAADKSFSGRTNVTQSWKDDRRIVASSGGDLAYEHGTLRMGYDENGKHTDFEAAMLIVYQARGGECRQVALTMYPIDDDEKK